MDKSLKPGIYVVAVSGGVDSMALLDMLRQQPRLQLVVAHLDHGIRQDSAEDRKLVQAYARAYGLPFVYHQAGLGDNTSEAAARAARYEFLHKVQEASGAAAIITAHHQDDVLETSIHNILRGTGRLGLGSLKSRPDVIRPLLKTYNKAALLDYAVSAGIDWREDSTNTNTIFARNYIRHKILPRLSPAHKQALLEHIDIAQQLNQEIDRLLINHLHLQPGIDRLDRKMFIGLPHVVAREVMAAWLRNNGLRQFNRKLLERLVVASKTLHAGKLMSIDGQHSVSITRDELALVSHDRQVPLAVTP